MRTCIAVAIIGLAIGLTGCSGTEVKDDAQAGLQVFENEGHALVVDVEDGMDELAANPGMVDSLESLIGPLVAKNAALSKANADFLALWTAYKAGKVGPSGSPVTVPELRTALAIIDSLTAPTPATVTTARRAALIRAAKKKPAATTAPPAGK